MSDVPLDLDAITARADPTDLRDLADELDNEDWHGSYRQMVRSAADEIEQSRALVSRLRDQLAVANEDYRQLAQKEFDEGERRAELEGVVARITELRDKWARAKTPGSTTYLVGHAFAAELSAVLAVPTNTPAPDAEEQQ